MPKLTCACGEVISLSEVPSPYGFKLIDEPAFEELRERLQALCSQNPEPGEIRDAIWVDLLGFRNPHIQQIYVCPSCGKLYFFAAASDEEARAIYRLESGTSLLADPVEPE